MCYGSDKDREKYSASAERQRVIFNNSNAQTYLVRVTYKNNWYGSGLGTVVQKLVLVRVHPSYPKSGAALILYNNQQRDSEFWIPQKRNITFRK